VRTLAPPGTSATPETPSRPSAALRLAHRRRERSNAGGSRSGSRCRRSGSHGSGLPVRGTRSLVWVSIAGFDRLGGAAEKLARMGAKEDALDALKEMGRHQAAGDHAGAVSAAEQLLRLVDELGDSRGREILRSTAASTWLTSKAVLDPGDVALPARCDDFYERFSALTFEGAATCVACSSASRSSCCCAHARSSRLRTSPSSWPPSTAPGRRLGS
jgi:hypothetical protein